MRLSKFVAVGVAALGLAVPASAGATGEIPSASLSLEPKSGSFYNNAFKSANFSITFGVSAPNPPNTTILPTRNATLRLPPASQLTFNPPANVPVCPDNQIGLPPVNMSFPVPTIVARCPDSVIGNGVATFLLGKQNQPNNSAVQLNGQVIVFNGGRNAQNEPRLKFYAYSYDTGIGIYTEGALTPAGELDIPLPWLSNDSAVNQLEFTIPGRTRTVELQRQGIEVTLPGGKAPNYAQAKCDTGTLPFSADFVLGERLQFPEPYGTPDGPASVFTDVGENETCTGVRATAKLAKPTIKGPAKAKRGKVATYRVTVRNAGGLPVKGVRLSASGKGVKVNTSVGTIAGESSKTVKIKVKFRSAGTVKATFQASSKNGGKQKAVKTIRVS